MWHIFNKDIQLCLLPVFPSALGATATSHICGTHHSAASSTPWFHAWVKLACSHAKKTRQIRSHASIVDRKCDFCVEPMWQNALPPFSSSAGNTCDPPASGRSSDFSPGKMRSWFSATSWTLRSGDSAQRMVASC